MQSEIDRVLRELQSAKKALEDARRKQEEAQLVVQHQAKELETLSVEKPSDLPLHVLQEALRDSLEKDYENKTVGEIEELDPKTKRNLPEQTFRMIDKITPEIILDIDFSTSLRPGCSLIVQYSMQSGEWDDSDCICVVDAALYPTTQFMQSSHSNIYEYFEYTDSVSVGGTCQCTLKLPPYAGVYRVVYARKSWSLNKTMILAMSEEFVLSSSVNMIRDSISSPSRRSAARIESKIALSGLVEDMMNISVLNVVFYAPKDLIVNRYMTWINLSGDNITLYTETECWQSNQSERQSCIVYGKLVIDANRTPFDILSDESIVTATSDGRINVRLKYRAQMKANIPKTRTPSINDLQNGHICCRFCGKVLLSLQLIKHVKQLPTGQFDNMIHDFICCEDVSNNISGKHVLTLSDISTPPGTILIGATFLSLSPNDYFSSQSSFLNQIHCKTGLSVLDLYSVEGQTASTASYQIQSTKNETSVNPSYPWANVVFMESCGISCTRCGLFLGEVSFHSENDQLRSEAEISQEGTSALTINDFKDIRLLLNNISFNTVTSELSVDSMTIEQVIVRVALHLNEVKACTIFCVYTGDIYSHVSLSTASSLGSNSMNPQTVSSVAKYADQREVIIFRILNRDYRRADYLSQSESEILSFKESIKVSYRIGLWRDVCNSTEARLPVHYHEYLEFKATLESRNIVFGNQSVFKGQKLSSLLT